MKAYVFPGQGSQFPGMGKDLYNEYQIAKKLFKLANEILGFEITKILFEGTKEELQQTRVTQPAIYIHSVVMSKVMGDHFQPDAVAGFGNGFVALSDKFLAKAKITAEQFSKKVYAGHFNILGAASLVFE